MPCFLTTVNKGPLVVNGPVVPVHVWLPEAIRTRLAQEKKIVPPPVKVVALIDTGASFTSIKPQIALQLGLVPRGTMQMLTAGNPRQINLYDVALNIGEAIGAQPVIFDPVRAGECPLEGQSQIDCLIGRDILSLCQLTYIGFTGSYGLAM